MNIIIPSPKMTSEEWYKIHTDLIILDPDGWDRKNYDFSWHQEPITETEFFRRRMWSTCLSNNYDGTKGSKTQ